MSDLPHVICFETRRTECPSCHAKHSFAKVKGQEGCGKCFACDVFLKPDSSQWFTPSLKTTVRLNATNPVRRDDMLASLHRAWVSHHPFLAIMRGLTSEDHIRRSPIGMDPDGSILFWYIDDEFTVWNAKRVMYGGFNRLRTEAPHYIYRGNPKPLFGEWQLGQYPHSTKLPVALVESEKTAVIMSHVAPDMLWLATGGAASLTTERALSLHHRSVHIFPDADVAGLEGATSMQRILSPICKSVSIVDTPLDESGLDLADVVYGESVK